MDDTRPIRILCMEDDPGTARLFQKKLESLGYAVDIAENGQTGLAMYDAAPYDVVTVDQHMPIYDGLQVIEFLAQRDPLPPTIMITGGGDEKLAVEAMKLGAGDYLVKDVNNGYLDLVPVVIEQLLDQRRLIREQQQATAAIRTQNRRLSLLNQLGQGLSETLNVEQIVRQLLHAAAEIAGADASSVWLWANGSRQTLRCIVAARRAEMVTSPKVTVDLDLSQEFVGNIVQSGKGMIAENVLSQRAQYLETEVYGDLAVDSLLGVPLVAHETVIGVLEVAHTGPEHFKGDDLGVVQTLAASAANAIDNANLVETLRQQAIDLRARNEDLDAFARTVANDLQQPVAQIINFARTLYGDCGDTFNDRQCSVIQQVIYGGRKMSSIIDELLLLAQIRKADTELVPLNMHSIVNRVQKRLGEMIESRHALVTGPEQWPDALGYAPWIEQVWMNYLSNALKYGDQPPEIAMGATLLEDEMVRLWIRNKGTTVPTDLQDELFKPFTRFHTGQEEGHGLGLSIVRRIVEKLGGEVGFTNEDGYGPVFSFTLRALKSAEGSQLEASEADTATVATDQGTSA